MAPSPVKTLPKGFIVTTPPPPTPFLGRGKLFIPPRQRFFENLLPPTAERGGGKFDLLYQNSIRKYQDDLKH